MRVNITITEQWEEWKHYSELRPSPELIAGIDALLSTAAQRERQNTHMKMCIGLALAREKSIIETLGEVGKQVDKYTINVLEQALQPAAASEPVKEGCSLAQAPGSARLRCQNCQYVWNESDVKEPIYDDGVMVCPNCLASANKLGGPAVIDGAVPGCSLREAEIESLLREVMRIHADSNSPEYNECDNATCIWCVRASRVIGQNAKL